MRFQGTIETDGVAVSVIKQNFMSRHSSGGSRKAPIDEDPIESIEELSHANKRKHKYTTRTKKRSQAF
ncbi:hypothetical protein BDF14DRAFT_1766663 [Spinellus fusiger]|nr:hypothetical protein BDF14DRAFT_1766663 [Spinellus fusiger]